VFQERSAVLLQRSAMLPERSAVFLQRSAVLPERSAGLFERSVVFRERSAMLRERSSAVFERSAALRERSTLGGKRSFVFLQPTGTLLLRSGGPAPDSSFTAERSSIRRRPTTLKFVSSQPVCVAERAREEL
jgi:hypothetical protein